MTVTTWQPPASGATTAHCEVTKTGRVLTGTAGFTLTALDENSTRVDWFEDVDVAPAWLTRPFARLVAAISAAGLKQSLRKLAADAEKL
jgi:carbon monoxide dehydrogenase subunit G